ncbi:similar to Saccharomyces cerevisiae YBR198C TAF5 Subunit (90 kDa) of TFIID and SAGA complexes, involved in RNA polymerase II transcription initiation and in chromatin modification [Maudiozyma saulgeensis]|uniref:Similar to Saccharomyces cerevisiae YBR198C TAF5 Subunit (90 kDa) of TFIID and SAGA complexes, involved in RNA polymerase II transcription initiation and in chromatin modification n=1 Tax=Maudiozyma saulgeensis TaxID=1789683 RepID=A0A1X7R1T1_9SACH|nr:similar to Saccharomyces cerevisiae YBR198C TAF5 Subunit (90 kDa) of TFIID and SAGA complexes, involved in RNA polymerase II transcription initiation and in chromatin modification [Kazachstania saulgeensis]
MAQTNGSDEINSSTAKTGNTNATTATTKNGNSSGLPATSVATTTTTGTTSNKSARSTTTNGKNSKQTGGSGTNGTTQQGQPQGQANRPNGQFSAQDLNRIVLEYLNKKGYHRTEAMLRAESGRTLTPPNKNSPGTTKNGTLPEPSTKPPVTGKIIDPVSNPTEDSSNVPATATTPANKVKNEQGVPAKRDNKGDIISREELEKETSPESYIRAYSLLKNWVDASIEIYKPELNNIMYPIFIYLFLNLVKKNRIVARRFFDKFSADFKVLHSTEINRLFSVNSIDHIKENEVANTFVSNKYRITLSRTTLNLLLYFLNENESVGGSLLIGVINEHIQPNIVTTVSLKDRLSDGIKNLANDSSANANVTLEINSAPVTLGPYPQDKEFTKEIETELRIKDDQERQQIIRMNASSATDRDTASTSKETDEKDKTPGTSSDDIPKHSAQEGENGSTDSIVEPPKKTLLDEYQDMKDMPFKSGESENVKKENGEDKILDESKAKDDKGTSGDNKDISLKSDSDSLSKVKLIAQKPAKDDISMKSPSIDSLPLPPKTSLDLKFEIQKIKESREAIELGNLQIAQPSVCMYTFHNTNRDMTSLDFSDDCRLAATGFQDSIIKLWSLDGSSLVTNKIPSHKREEMLRTDPTTSTLVGHSGAVYATDFSPDNRFLLSGSEDKTVRLWSLDTHTALVSYKGHNHPVWDVKFSPLGHYFATASHDQTARLWSCDHIYPLRIFAGHLNDVDTISFHPNGCYVFTGSSDKTCRMWDINTGNSVRLFLGHTAPVVTTAVTPDGRWLCTGGEDGVINVWDIGTGKRLKQMRGHGKNAVHSFSFNKEGNALVSSGADHSVRVWDLKKATTEPSAEPEQPFVAYAGDVTASVNQDIKEFGRRRAIIPTSDLMSTFYTKKTPVFKVKFTRNNLALAGGAFRG